MRVTRLGDAPILSGYYLACKRSGSGLGKEQRKMSNQPEYEPDNNLRSTGPSSLIPDGGAISKSKHLGAHEGSREGQILDSQRQ